MSVDNTPILIGGGQYTQRDVALDAVLSPVDLMAACARRAAEDARGGDALLAAVDRLVVVNLFGWRYPNAPRALAERLELTPHDAFYTAIGGNTPQWLVSDTAQAISEGRVGVALLVGAETMNSAARAKKTNTRLPWSTPAGDPPPVLGDDRDGVSPYELNHGFMLPVQIYPMFENALRSHAGRDIPAHQAYIGALYSGFTKVAAQHPYAWFPTERSAEDLMTVTADNRYIGFPYPKRVNAIIDVDQGAAVIMTSVGRARALGIPESRWVYLRGSGEAHDHWFVTERTNYFSSPAIRAAGKAALAAAGTTIDQIAYFDLYSCFPSAVQLGRHALGIRIDDPRPLTVTGGLAYFGGPGNNYVMHSIATMLDRVREQPGSLGLVTGLGWYVTKHAVGIYSTTPGEHPWRRGDPKAPQAIVDADPKPVVVEEPHGSARIETYTVLHDRDGAPMRGVVIGRLGDARRFIAETPADRDILETLERTEGVGCPGVVEGRDGQTIFTPS